MSDVVPSFYGCLAAGMVPGNGLFSNLALRVGEIQRLIPPEDPDSRSGKFTEYDVLVQHREDGTAVTKIYHNCPVVNLFGGVADRFYYTLREPEAGQPGDDPQPGSWALVHCINGETGSAVIVGGIRDERDDDTGRKDKGHHLEWVFNGVKFEVADDGSWKATYGGKTTGTGDLDPDVDEDSVGTTVEVRADGSFAVTSPGGAQTVTVDHPNATITIQGDADVVVAGQQIHLGQDADQHMVLGDVLKDILSELLQTLATETHTHPLGPTGPPIQAPVYTKLLAKLETLLSTHEFVKRQP